MIKLHHVLLRTQKVHCRDSNKNHKVGEFGSKGFQCGGSSNPAFRDRIKAPQHLQVGVGTPNAEGVSPYLLFKVRTTIVKVVNTYTCVKLLNGRRII